MDCFKKILPTFVFCSVGLFATMACTHQRMSDHIFLLSQTTPAEGLPESIGSYSQGCLRGANSLPPQGKGFLVMHPSRGRFWGHPELTSFIQDIGNQWNKYSKSSMIIGDLSHARGGPMLSTHVSHQIGLDVDIWLQMALAPDENMPFWSLGDREIISAKSVLSADKEKLNPEFWGNDQIKLIELTAQDARTNRIFVHPLIKQYLCGVPELANQDWLKKIRPWWGHDDHIHVRLNCPANSPNCEKQEQITNVGCDETLAWWFSEEALQQKDKDPDSSIKNQNLGENYLGQLKNLPLACQQILNPEN